MELWQVRKQYRQVAMRLRRSKAPLDEHLERVEEQVITALAQCDRYETELAVLRLALRCSKARLRRMRNWLECSGLLRAMSPSLVRKDDEPAADELVVVLEKRGRETNYLRQLLDELAHLQRRLTETKERLGRMTQEGTKSLQLLFTHLRVRGDEALD
jgi:hypothetical protein